MNNLNRIKIVVFIGIFLPFFNLAQSPNMRSLSGFVFFTTTGAISNAGTSIITGNVGTGTGAVSGLSSPTIFTGAINIADSITIQASYDLTHLYNELYAAEPTVIHTAVFGGGETLSSGVYYTGGAGSIVGTLNLDAAGNSNAVFIIKFNGAFSAGDVSIITLLNGAQACNVFWLAEGAIAAGANSEMKGNFLANNAAVAMAAGCKLEGRLLSTTGAIAVSTGNYSLKTGCSSCSQPPGTSRWLGADSNWKNLNNWCGGVPLLHSNVIIPASLTHYPVITNGAANFNNIDIEPGASFTVSGAGVCNLFGAVSNAGIFDLTDGTLNLAGINMTVGGSSFLNGTVKNLNISNGTATAITTGPSNMLSIKNNLSFLTSNNIFTTNGNLTLVSSATNTASVTDITNNGTLTGNVILGNANVERFIPSLKRWRYLAVNTLPGTGSKNTFQENWMEGQAPGVNGGGEGKGLWITDVGYTSNPGNYDALSFTPSIKWFNGTVYMGIGNPITYDIRSHAAYFTYIRGDRGSTAANGLLSTTVLRTFGNLVQGDKILNIPVGINGIGTGNPYASAIDLRKVAFSDSNNVNIFVWDPNLGGGYGQGGFQTLSRDPKVDQHFTILPGGGSYGLQSTMNTIESGLGFFIQGSLTSRTLTFKETAKTPSQNILSRTTVVPQKIYVKLSVRDANDSLTMADAFQVRLSSNYNTALDANDARKRTGSFESVASNREGTLLVMEYRNSAMLCNDSLLINSINLAPKNYCWTIINTSLNEPGRTGVLVDKFLGTEMLLNLDSITNYNFTVTGEEGSSNVNRFLVVFRQTAVLQIEHISLAANRMPNDAITLKWTAENETKINHYETQKSTNAVDFLSFGINTVATDNTGGSPNYLKVDGSKNSGDIFYRIKAVHYDMQVTYSTIVKVKALKEEGSILVYPNPVGNKTVMLYFKEIPFGNYHLSLTETTGRTIFKGNILVSSAMIKKEILINKNYASGNYNLEITNKAGFKKSIKVTVVN